MQGKIINGIKITDEVINKWQKERLKSIEKITIKLQREVKGLCQLTPSLRLQLCKELWDLKPDEKEFGNALKGVIPHAEFFHYMITNNN